MAVLQDTSGYRGPYQYYNSVDPNSLYNADGTLKSNKAGAATQPIFDKALDMGLNAALPGLGTAEQALQGISKSINQIGTPAAAAGAAAIDPLDQSFNYFANLKQNQKGQSSGTKAGEDIGEALGGIFFDPWMAYKQAKDKQNQEAGYNYNKQFYNGGGYGYELDKNGMRFAPQGLSLIHI